MNTDHIKTFLAVYQAGSFVSVAKERNVAPSSITRSIAALEGILKTRLFQRSTRKIMPTEAGVAYYRRMLAIMDEFDDAHDTLAARASGPSGRLRVTASVSYGQIIIAPQLPKFREQFPDVDLELILSDGRMNLIAEQIDVALRHGRLPDSSLTAKKLSDVSYHLVASPNYLANRPSITRPEDLATKDIVTFSYDDFRAEWLFEHKGVSQSVPIKPSLTISNSGAIRECVLNDAGISLLADWTISEDLKNGTLIEVLPKWRASGTSQNSAIWIVYPSSRFVPAKTRAFVDFMVGM